jgi:transposase
VFAFRREKTGGTFLKIGGEFQMIDACIERSDGPCRQPGIGGGLSANNHISMEDQFAGHVPRTAVASDNTAVELARIGERLLGMARDLPSRQAPVDPNPVAAHGIVRDCMTLEQLAEYWDVSRSAIHKWQHRANEDSPLPHGYVGDSPRFYRAECEEWSRQERKRREAKQTLKKKIMAQKQPGRQTDDGSEGTMLATLTTAKALKGDSSHGGIQTIQGKAHRARRSKLANR